jgi:hypothetical protein
VPPPDCDAAHAPCALANDRLETVVAPPRPHCVEGPPTAFVDSSKLINRFDPASRLRIAQGAVAVVEAIASACRWHSASVLTSIDSLPGAPRVAWARMFSP